MALTARHSQASLISIAFTCAAIARGSGRNSPGRKGRSALRRNTSRCLKSETDKVYAKRISPTRSPGGGTSRVHGPFLERQHQAGSQRIHFLPDTALDQSKLGGGWTSSHFTAR